MCWFVCCPYYRTRFSVHIRWLYAFIKDIKADLYLIFCDVTAQCDGARATGFATSRVRRKTLQTFAKPILQCAFVGLRTPLNKKVVISIGGASRSTGQPLRPQRLSGQGRTGQASNKYEKKNNDVNGQFE